MVSEDAIFLTRLFNFCILALEKLREMVTARGRPSGMATTTMVIAMITALRSSEYTSFLISLKSYGVLFYTGMHVKKFVQLVGRAPANSSKILIRLAKKVQTATSRPKFPILPAMTSSFF